MLQKELQLDKNKLLQVFFENSYDGIFITDSVGKVIQVNPAVVSMLDVAYEDLVGSSLGEILNKGFYVNSVSQKVMESNQVATGLTVGRNGVKIISTSVPIFDDNGQLQLIVTNCRPLMPIEEFVSKNLATFIPTDFDERDPLNSEKTQTIVYQSKVMKEIMGVAKPIAQTDCTVVITGDTGTGKSLLARHIHEQSDRADERFVEINCSTIPENLMETELFGYEPGAFTGASTRGKKGLLEVASNGTVFLDEISEIPLHLQAKLLQVLDTNSIMRVGGTEHYSINTRVIAATNKNLKQLVIDGVFREDLFYRLNVIPIDLPPLKTRKDDILPLIISFMDELNIKYNYKSNDKKILGDKLIQSMIDYDWPGNIRQLKNIIERIFILSFSKRIVDGDIHTFLDEEVFTTLPSPPCNLNSKNNSIVFDPAKDTPSLTEHLQSAERSFIESVLAHCDGNVTAAATHLGMHRTTLYKKIRELECKF